jgi:dTDP-4-dehydrorhamnose 3,5-epimerase
VKITPLAVPDVLLIEPTLHEDARGSLVEIFNERRFREHDLSCRFVQDNVSRSKRGVIRGLHYQRARPQGKLISAMEGAIFDVVVDIRVGSPTFSQWVSMELQAGDGQLLYVPPGFAHGFTALTDGAAVLYKCSDFYVPDDQFGILFDDPALAIDWPVDAPILVERDRQWPTLDRAGDTLFTFEGRS